VYLGTDIQDLVFRNGYLVRAYLQVDVVSSEIQRVAQKHEGRLHLHENVQTVQLMDNMGIGCRLQREKNLLSSFKS
jgi:hypothetical protein